MGGGFASEELLAREDAVDLAVSVSWGYRYKKNISFCELHRQDGKAVSAEWVVWVGFWVPLHFFHWKIGWQRTSSFLVHSSPLLGEWNSTHR